VMIRTANGRHSIRLGKVGERIAETARRMVPIIEALRPHLERAYRERAPGAIYVVPRARGGRNLGTTTRCGRRTGQQSPERRRKIRHQIRLHQRPSAAIRSRQRFTKPAKNRLTS
jgi:hypothetical protein